MSFLVEFQGLFFFVSFQRCLGRPSRTRLGREVWWEIAGGAAPSTPSSRLARGITCPPPGVNRDPPALAPAGTIRPGG